MGNDVFSGRCLLRAILFAMPPAVRREYADEIMIMNHMRRQEIDDRGATRFWLAELAAALRATLTAWTDSRSPKRNLTPRGGRDSRSELGIDLRSAAREIRRNPAHSALIIGTLAVGIGAVLTVFAMVDGLLLRPIPVPEPDRVVRVFQALNASSPYAETSYPMFVDYQRATSVQGPAGWTVLEAGFRHGEVSDRASVGLVSGNFFEVLRVGPAVGRLLQPDDDIAGATRVAVLSHDLWSQSFGRDRAVVGSTVRISGTTFTVIGVAPPGFKGATLQSTPDIWTTLLHIRDVAESNLYAAPNILETRAFSWLSMVGRLEDGVSLVAAEAELDQIARAVQAWDVALERDPADDLDVGPQAATVDGQVDVHVVVVGGDDRRGGLLDAGLLKNRELGRRCPPRRCPPRGPASGFCSTMRESRPRSASARAVALPTRPPPMITVGASENLYTRYFSLNRSSCSWVPANSRTVFSLTVVFGSVVLNSPLTGTTAYS